MLNVGLVGLGLTGSAIARYILQERTDLRLVMAAAGPRSTKAGADLGVLQGSVPCGLSVCAAEEIPAVMASTHPDVVIDFSKPEATLSLLPHYERHGCGVVVGTTGFSDHQMGLLRRTAERKRCGLMYAPNITRGVNVLMLIAELASKYLPGYDIEVIERHHRYKKDSPSGTAAKLAVRLHDLRGSSQTRHGREGRYERTRDEIGVHSIRAGGIVGVHEVVFASDTDELVITHRAESRTAFAQGAADAAVWMASRRGYYLVEDMITGRERPTQPRQKPVSRPLGRQALNVAPEPVV